METGTPYQKFVILGGGIAGLTTAIALRKIGIESLIVEAAPEFNPAGAGIVLAVNALKAYQHLGMNDILCQAGNLLQQMSIYDQFGRVMSRTHTDAFEKNQFNLSIHRSVLHEVLLSQLDASVVRTGKKSKVILDNENGYEIVFQDDSRIHARYIIVAEGIHSATRQQLLPQSEKRYSGYTCWRGVTTIPGLKIYEASETWGKNGRFGIVPLGGDKIYWFAVKNAIQNDPEMNFLKSEGILKIFRNYHEPIGRVIRSTPDEQIIWNDIYDLKPVKQYAFGNMVMIGDAAHATTPNMGQGACQAIEDAVILAHCLKNYNHVQDAFQAFENKRMKRTHYIVNQSWKMGRMAQMENRTGIAVRNFILRSVPEKYLNSQLQKVYDFKL